MIGLFGGNGRRGPIVVGCAPSELHDLGAMMSSLFLMRRGWDVVYLGPQLPLADLIEAARSVKPLLVCLSATTTETASELIAIGRSLKESCPDILFGYGGRIFNINPELRVSMPGTFLGHDARETVETVNTLVGRSSMSLAD